MERKIIFYSSYCNQKYYFNPEFEKLPLDVKKEIQIMGVTFSEKIRGAFSIGFYENGDVFLESKEEIDFSYDDIGAELEIKKIQMEQKELLRALSLWYKIFMTEEAEEIKKQLLEGNDLK